MHGRNPNRKENGVSLRDGERHTDTAPSGSMGRDGYARIERRPRVRDAEITDLERADRIEEYAHPMPYSYYD